MPHLRIDYSANLDPQAAMGDLCQALGAAMASLRDEAQAPLFPLHGTRVLAYPAPFFCVADGAPGKAFVYLNLRITPGRSAAMLEMAGACLLDAARAHFERMAPKLDVALTLHIDEIQPAYEGRYRSV